MFGPILKYQPLADGGVDARTGGLPLAGQIFEHLFRPQGDQLERRLDVLDCARRERGQEDQHAREECAIGVHGKECCLAAVRKRGAAPKSAAFTVPRNKPSCRVTESVRQPPDLKSVAKGYIHARSGVFSTHYDAAPHARLDSDHGHSARRAGSCSTAGCLYRARSAARGAAHHALSRVSDRDGVASGR